ncbi:hypothetical protein FRC06_003289 [Ceratobasidium sp. 370]|nr:hypothetical protein FRC06_003289 [Ceratobasidium sp. 370]
MRASFALLALAAVASASSVSKRQLPNCAMACIVKANTGTCDATDNTCLCKSDAFVQSTYQCIASTCSASDLQTAIDGARALCAAAGVTLTQSVPASTGAATATAPGAATSKPASASASPTATPNGAVGFAGVSGMAGAVAAAAGFMFAL